jgi:hypothetical protein
VPAKGAPRTTGYTLPAPPPAIQAVRRSRRIQKIDATQYQSGLIAIKPNPSTGAVEEDVPYRREVLRESVDAERFNAAWLKYKNQMLKLGNALMATTLTTAAPELRNETEIHLTLHSRAEELHFENAKVELLGFLRRELKNDLLNLHYKISAAEVSGRPYTNEEKLKYLAAKHPQIAEWLQIMQQRGKNKQ